MRWSMPVLLALLLLTKGAAAATLGAEITDSYVEPQGAFVNIVMPDSAAARAGLRPGDVITGLDGVPIDGAASLVDLVARHRPGDRVRIDIVRPGAGSKQLAAILGEGAAPSPPPAAPLPTSPSARAAAPPPVLSAVRWASFRDPVEGAFTIELPAGWRVEGGTRRMSAVEVRSWVVAQSPDGAIELFQGDPDVPIYTVPNQGHAIAGLREGMVYDAGFNQRFVIMRYLPGEAYADDWGQARVERSCPGAVRQGARALPQANQAIDMAFAAGGVRTSIRAGEASFACSRNGAPVIGYVFAGTELSETQGTGLWDVKALAGFVATAPRAGEAATLLSHAVASYRIDTGWLAAQQGTTMAVSRIVTDTNEVVSRSIADRFRNASDAQDRNAAAFDQAIRGTQNFFDPATGTRWELENRPHQWVGPGHPRPVATEGSDPPFPGARELKPLPPGQ